jgi:hypothetical protein
MDYTWYNSAYKQFDNARFIVINIVVSIILIQVSVTCGASPRAYMPTALAAPNVNCANPTPPNSGSTAPSATPSVVVINEVLTSPQSQWTCTGKPNYTPNQESGWAKYAWVEIYNPQNQPLDLYAAHATFFYETQSTQQHQFYSLPFGSTIAAHGFLVFFPFTNLFSNGYTQISSVRLTISQTVIDQVSLPPLAVDTSYARIPDGSNHWQITATPTIASSNTISNGASTPTPKPKSTHTRSTRTSNDGPSTDTPNPGVQPTWSALRLPSSESNNAETQQRNSSLSSADSNAPADAFDFLKNTLLALFTILFIFTLLWGWRLYRKRKR